MKKFNTSNHDEELTKYLSSKLKLNSAKGLRRLKRELSEFDGLEDDFLDFLDECTGNKKTVNTSSNVEEDESTDYSDDNSDTENDKNDLTSGDDEEILSSDEKASDEGVLSSEAEVLSSDEEILSSDADEQVLSSDAETYESHKNSVKRNKKILDSEDDEEILSSEEDTLTSKKKKDSEKGSNAEKAAKQNDEELNRKTKQSSKKRNTEIKLEEKAPVKKMKNDNNEIKKLIVRYVNRISEGNLDYVTKQIETEILKKMNHFSEEVSKQLYQYFADQVIASCINNMTSTLSLVASQTACIVALSRKNSAQLCYSYIIQLIQWLDVEFSKLEDISEKVEIDKRFVFRLAVASFSLLFDYSATLPSLVTSFIEFLLSKQQLSLETKLDLILTCLRHTGYKMRQEYDTEFSNIISMTNKFLEPYKKDLTGRSKYLMLDIQELQKSAISALSQLNYLRTWLSNFGSHLLIEETSWSGLLKGFSQKKYEKDTNSTQDEVTESDLTTQAAKLRLHTPLQKSVYSALMSATNPKDAVQKLLKLANTKKKIPHVIAVIVYLALKEKFFNAYYSHLLNELATIRSRLGDLYKKHIKETIISQLAMLNCLSTTQITVFAQTLCYIATNTLITDLKIIRFIKQDDELKSSGKFDQFVKELCTQLSLTDLKTPEKKNLWKAQIQSIAELSDYKVHFLCILQSLKKTENVQNIIKLLSEN